MCTRISRTARISACLCYACAVCAFAQQRAAPVLPSVADPAAIERRQQALPEPLAKTQTVDRPQENSQSPPPAGSDTRFTLVHIELLGVSAYKPDELLVPYKELLGTEITVGRVFQIADEITARYRKDGWPYSRVLLPAQEITNGQVTLQAVEGYAAEMEFSGDGDRRFPYAEQIRDRLAQEKPLRQRTLERYMLLMNDVPGATVAIAMSPSSEQFGGLRLATRVSEQRFEASVGASNRGSRVLGPMQYEASVGLNSLFSGYDATRVTFVTTGSKEIAFIALSQSWLVSSEGTRLELAASHSKSEPDLGQDFQALNLETNATSFGLTLSHPFLRSRSDNFTARLGVDYHKGETRDAFDQAREDRLPTVRLGFTFDTTDAYNGVNVLDLQISKGFVTGGATTSADENSSRPGASANFEKAELYAARLQSLGAGWSVLLGLQGQFAGTDLLSSEEFAFGGPLFGRAYDPSELVGDSGIAGKLELRYALSAFDAGVPPVTLYAFYDAGNVYRRNVQPGEKQRESATAAGGGIRFNVGRYLHGYVEGAAPLTRNVAAEGNKNMRIFGGITASF